MMRFDFVCVLYGQQGHFEGGRFLFRVFRGNMYGKRL